MIIFQKHNKVFDQTARAIVHMKDPLNLAFLAVFADIKVIVRFLIQTLRHADVPCFKLQPISSPRRLWGHRRSVQRPRVLPLPLLCCLLVT